MTVTGVGEAIRRAAAVVRRIIGVPDYERYLAHVQQCHPDTQPMTRRQFEESRLYDKYSRPGQRCC
ncbi:MAG: YbdD/YjiX family protein [Gemmatimonadaceae bacterium]